MPIRSLSAKTLLLRLSSSAQPPRSLSILVAHFSSLNLTSSSSHSQPRRYHYDEESRNVRVSVWWDFENCGLPAGVNVFKVTQAITTAIRTSGIKGSITITAYGDVLQLSRTNQEALSSTGISLSHVPNRGKNSADKSLLVDLMHWVSQNPPPAHLFLISSDRDFASTLHRLRMNNYNILLASKESASSVLCSAATIMWDWFSLVRGENITGKHFNQPPDGPYSWYGHYKGRLEDPFGTTEQSTCVKTEELSDSHSNSDSKIRPIPKAVVKQIRQILSLYPKGISIVDLRAELSKSRAMIDKEFYGYKKFSRFLLSMTELLKVQPGCDGHFVVRGIMPKSSEPFDSVLVTGSDLRTGSNQRIETDEGIGDKSTSTAVEAKPEAEPRQMQQNIPENSKHAKVEVKKPPINVQEPVLVGEQSVEVKNERVRNDRLVPFTEHYFTEEGGFLKKLKRLWFGSSDTQKDCLPENNFVPGDGSESQNEQVVGESKKLPVQEVDPVSPLPSSSASTGSAEDSEIRGEAGRDKSESPGLFNRLLKWFKFWGEDTMARKLTDQSSGTQDSMRCFSQKHEIFAEDSFWSDVESVLHSPRGSVVISQSKTREEMVKNLCKEGLSCLKPLTEADVLQLVDLLISEKKWIEECPSEALPFRVSQVAPKRSGLVHSRAADGLRSIFLVSKSQSPEQDGEKKPQNIAHSGASVLRFIDQKPSEKSRNEVLGDCQKMVKEILKEYPEGYNMGCFRKDFLEKYGYHLDIEKLGYQKLQSLIQIMPGARTESGYIVSSSTAPDDLDLSFEELGPVSETKGETQPKKLPNYEPSLSDDGYSDSEGENSTTSQIDWKKKRPVDEDDSSLLQILDSWYSSKEASDTKEKSDDVRIDSSADGSKDSKSSRASGSLGKKQRPTKTYSFVSNSVDDNKEKLIDGILGSLKKSNETRMQG